MNMPSGIETLFRGLDDFLTAIKFWGAYQLRKKLNSSNTLDPHFKNASWSSGAYQFI